MWIENDTIIDRKEDISVLAFPQLLARLLHFAFWWLSKRRTHEHGLQSFDMSNRERYIYLK